ncbi:MAG: glutathione S-transferase family protein [Rhodospirillaceae bacterium]|jgi:GST-like protein|nr:glutathione S-transferase family protein [Rhodospirillaceae bacterium]MBT3885069.1 glutathione S-transferase family protein [Rhodospirillaceae bacterium]MBT4116598.1 glutathione S-transferase family protein [Rhodospirillaceae bacterium]MBT4672432.1 glutathione S-transferase family protein [Rhodospirillaceae bacterium]MBT4718600.1 glutathione S-transferase family protein [Rhodospirillaceae bacterium]
MIDLYTWFTPNGRKVSIMLEECGLEYEVHPVNLGKDEQHAPEFLKISPNNKIPAIVDRDNGLSLMETGAILLYLADKTGKFALTDEVGRWKMMEWMMFQMASVGPMLGQVHVFTKYGEGKNVEASARYLNEAKRLYGVMDERLENNHYFLGDEYTIVDMAIFPWAARWDWQTVDLHEFPNVLRWFLEIAARPAVQTGWRIPENDQPLPIPE